MATLVLFLGFTLFLQGAFGEIVCKELPVGVCSFSIESSGKRCVLEKYYESNDGAIGFQCKTSEVVVKGMWEMIESDECTNACGVDRNSVGISSDSLLDPKLTAMICSTECYQNCPNIIDLYYNLALGEGVYLPELCNVQRTMPRRRAMSQLLSSGSASSPTNGPITSESSVKVYTIAEPPCN
ncbi:uncharacterized protein LOC112517763 [Cynara cardunculus var. scolymus]|uniref:uncharacterized protein LOC112517763 n=1 Tax=Cynara cardunculus var. scolymus TaxID=59895 RepID=UPI000D62F885|nr:uncharacterized protein LOC112517763 [Cynara cardunculus var. scolymus]